MCGWHVTACNPTWDFSVPLAYQLQIGNTTHLSLEAKVYCGSFKHRTHSRHEHLKACLPGYLAAHQCSLTNR